MSEGPSIGSDLFAPPRRATPGRQETAPATGAPRPRNIPPGGFSCFVCGEYAPFGKGNWREPETMRWACSEHRKALG
jgi:hypothetical protein